MAEQVSHIAKEAKGLQQGLKEALKTQDPWDREIEIQRKSLREQYLRLLLVHPYVKESKDVETHLWMQTSYAFISVYKQRITALDRTLQSAPRQPSRQGGHGPVEYRKLIQRFRQFLAEEEKFWTALVLRYRQTFALDEAHSALVELGIDTPSHSLPDATEIRNATGHMGRNHFRFPPEHLTPPSPKTPAERQAPLAILSKALVCLGDIARYRELYNESGGRSKAGHEDSTLPAKRNGRNRRGVPPGFETIARPRNYDKAENCYKQAQLLVPNEGNPSHQLAILASYQKDTFASIYHYYRSLCVRQPYDTASENLGTVLSKALDQWKLRLRREKEKGRDPDEDATASLPPFRVRTFKDRVVVLHALWRLSTEKMDSISPKHDEELLKDFSSLVSERQLPDDIITETVIVAQSALWKHRMIRDHHNGPNKRSNSSSVSALDTESRIVTHILALHRALLDIGIREIAEVSIEETSGSDLAQRITAPFRRTLPALRISGKWLRANFKYLTQSNTLRGNDKVQVSTDSNRKEKRKPESELSIAGSHELWSTYVRFSNALLSTFPAAQLPEIEPLREDIDIRGFLPLKKLMTGESKEGIDATTKAVWQGQGGHPNEEQLMRIADLIRDAKLLANLENSPIRLHNDQFALGGSELVLSKPFIPRQMRSTAVAKQESATLPKLIVSNNNTTDDDAMTETSRTDDDPVDEVFRQEPISEEEDDEIVWDPRASVSPIGPSLPAVSPSPPHRSPTSPTGVDFSAIGPLSPYSLQSPGLPNIPPLIVPTTAQDLLRNMGLSSNSDAPRRNTHHQETITTPQPQLLFGEGRSIWSTSMNAPFDTTGVGMPAAHSQRSHSQQLSGSSSRSISNSTWPTTSSQNPQTHPAGLASTGYGHAIDGLPSHSISLSHNEGQSYDMFDYSHSAFGRLSIQDNLASYESSSPITHPQDYRTEHFHHSSHFPQVFAPSVSQFWDGRG